MCAAQHGQAAERGMVRQKRGIAATAAPCQPIGQARCRPHARVMGMPLGELHPPRLHKAPH